MTSAARSRLKHMAAAQGADGPGDRAARRAAVAQLALPPAAPCPHCAALAAPLPAPSADSAALSAEQE